MFTLKEYNLASKELMNKWMARCHAEEGKSSFACDGIVDPKTWFSLPQNEERILVLLKEAYDMDGYSIWDQTKWIRKERCTSNCSKECQACGATGYTFNPIAEWVYGILNTTADNSFEYDNWLGITKDKSARRYNDVRDSLLKRIAIINIKKANGGKTSDDNDLYYYAARDKDLLTSQIDMISPTLIICGSTYGMLRCLFPELAYLPDISSGVSKTDRFKVIAACHPSKPASGKEKYERVVANYRTSLCCKE